MADLCELTDGLPCSPICLGNKPGVCPHLIKQTQEFVYEFLSCTALESLADRVTARPPP